MSDQPIDISIVSTFQGSGATAARAALVDLNQSAAQIVTGLRAASAAAGESDTQFLAAAGAASQAALAVGDAAKAEQILAAALGASGAAEEGANQKTIQRIQLEARALAAAGDRRGAINLVASALANQTERTDAMIRAEIQLTQLENQAAVAAAKEAAALEAQAVATTETASASSGLGSAVSGLLSPVVLVTAAVAAGIGVVKSFGDALHFEGDLQETRAAFDGVYGSVSVGNAVLDRANAIGAKYGFTQKEIGTAFRELSPIIRASTASTQDQVDALARFSVLHPEDAVNQLKTAVEGLQSGGRISGIAKDLGLTTVEQERLKKAVADGKDVFVALNAVMDAHGVILQTAAERMDGYAGAARRAAQAGEDLKQAQAAFAQGPGIAFLEEETRLTTGLSRLLGGSGGLSASFQAIGQNLQQSNTYQLVYNQSIENGATDAEAAAAANRAVAQELQASAGAASAAAGGVLRSADADDRVAAAAAAAKPKIEALTGALLAQANATGLADQRKGEQTGTDLSAGEFNKFSDLARKGATDRAAEQKKIDDKAAKDADVLQSVQFDNRLKQTKTNAEKIALLRQKEAGTSDPLEKARIEGQIIDLQNQKNTGLSKELNLRESIYDSTNKQKDALLDIEELTIKDRQADRKAAKDDRTAQNILRALSGRTDARAEDFRGRAQDVIALDSVEDRKRAQAIAEKQATANASLSPTGKLLQSAPVAGAPATISGPQVGSATSGAPATAPTSGAGGGQTLIIQLADGGRVLAQSVSPFLMDDLLHGVRAVAARVGG